MHYTACQLETTHSIRNTEVVKQIEVHRASEIAIAVHFKTCHAKEVSATMDIRKIHFSKSIVSLQFGFVVAAAIQHHQFCKTREIE